MTLLSLKDYRDGNIPQKSRNSTTEEIANNIKEILENVEIEVDIPTEILLTPSASIIVPPCSMIESPDSEKIITACDAAIAMGESLKRLNEATESDLLEVKGIGPKTAQKILGKRPFYNWEEVKWNLSESIYLGLYNKFSIC